MVVSYNSISGVPLGRHEDGNVVAYSAEWGFEQFADIAVLEAMTGVPFYDDTVDKNCRNAAEGAFSNLETMLADDLLAVETVYVYVGESARDRAMSFIQKLQSIGKTVHMVACDCRQQSKIRFAEQLGIDITWCQCGGENECGEIFRKYSATAPATTAPVC